MKAIHTIKRQVLNLSTSGKLDAWLLQNKLKEIMTSEVSSRLDRACGEVSIPNEDVVYVDTIELDIGTISLKDLDAKWAEKIEIAFKEELKQLLLKRASSTNHTVPKVDNNHTHTKLNYLLFFFYHGSLPWWGNSFRNQTVDELLSGVIEQHPKEFITFFRSAANVTNIIKRFVFQFTDDSFIKLYTLLTDELTAIHIRYIIEVCRSIRYFTYSGGATNFCKETALLHALRSSCKNLDPLTIALNLVEILAVKSELPKNDFIHRLVNELQKTSQATSSLHSPISKHQPIFTQLITEVKKLAVDPTSNIISAGDATHLATPTIQLTTVANNTSIPNDLENLVPAVEHSKTTFPIEKTSTTASSKQTSNAPNATVLPKLKTVKNSNEQQHNKQSNIDKPLLADSAKSNKIHQTTKDSSESKLLTKKGTSDDKFNQDEQNTRFHTSQHKDHIGNNSSVNKTIETNESVHNPPSASTPENPGIQESVRKSNSIASQILGHPSSQGKNKLAAQPSALSEGKKILLEKSRQSNAFTNKPPVPEDIQECYVLNAGLVILSPYLNRFFRNLDLLTGTTFSSIESRTKAIILLNYLINDQPDVSEYNLLLNKILCGLPIGIPIEKLISISDQEKNHCREFLQAVVQNWPSLKNTSVNGFQQAFLNRSGVLRKKEQEWTLTVERKSYDMIMETLPWSINLIKFTWMEKPLYAEW